MSRNSILGNIDRESLIAGGLIAAVGAGAYIAPGKVVDATYGSGRAQDYVEQSGFTNVHHTDTDTTAMVLRGCNNIRDAAAGAKYEFTATALNGEDVKLFVCKGLLKGATIRQK